MTNKVFRGGGGSSPFLILFFRSGLPKTALRLRNRWWHGVCVGCKKSTKVWFCLLSVSTPEVKGKVAFTSTCGGEPYFRESVTNFFSRVYLNFSFRHLAVFPVGSLWNLHQILVLCCLRIRPKHDYLIANETCFAMKSVHMRWCVTWIMIEHIYSDHYRHYLVSVMIRLNTLNSADYAGEGECPKDPNWAYCENKCLVEIWDDEEIQHYNQRCVESRLFERTLPQNNDTSLIQAHCIAMQNQNLQPRTKVYKWKAKNKKHKKHLGTG